MMHPGQNSKKDQNNNRYLGDTFTLYINYKTHYLLTLTLWRTCIRPIATSCCPTRDVVQSCGFCINKISAIHYTFILLNFDPAWCCAIPTFDIVYTTYACVHFVPTVMSVSVSLDRHCITCTMYNHMGMLGYNVEFGNLIPRQCCTWRKISCHNFEGKL